MAVKSNVCNARNRATCRFHGVVDHARMDRDAAQAVYENAKKEYDEADPAARDTVKTRWGTHSSPIKNRMTNAKTKLTKMQAILDSVPSELKQLKADAAANPNDKGLQRRLTKAEAYRKQAEFKASQDRAALKAETARQKANKEMFDKILEEKNMQADLTVPDGWKVGYQRAISGVIAEEGRIVNGPGYSSYGAYFADVDHEKTAHFRKCGALDIRNVEEDSWEEWDFNSMSSVQSSRTEYKVTAEATCKCGKLVKEKIQVEGTFSDITRKVLAF